ncbi:hypothetical protein CEQ90_15685 [Lewinellaceae bacterium SD302]|nr:hypothetical protein CEQ90_15685 [Lewinellaceae bacterium SD302]
MPVNPLENFINNERDGFNDAEPPAGLWDRISNELDGDDDQTNKDGGGGHRMSDEDGLETFVRVNRPAFDRADVPERTWKRIRKQLPGRVMRLIPKERLNKYRAIAAAAVLLLISTLFLGREMGIRAVQQQELAAIESVAPGFGEMEEYYQGEIDRTFRLVSQQNDDPLLKADLEAIDEAMIELRDDLSTVPKEERAEVIANLIESYQIKLAILQKILDKLPSASPDESVLKTNENETINL